MNQAERIVDRLLEADDPKDFLMGADDNYKDVLFVAKYIATPIGFTGVEEKPYPHYFSDGGEDGNGFFGDFEGGWERATKLRLGDYVSNGVLDTNDFPFGTESIIVINPDGSRGDEIPVSEIPSRFFGINDVVDTYVSPEHRQDEDDLQESRINWDERLRRLRIRKGLDPETGEPLPE